MATVTDPCPPGVLSLHSFWHLTTHSVLGDLSRRQCVWNFQGFSPLFLLCVKLPGDRHQWEAKVRGIKQFSQVRRKGIGTLTWVSPIPSSCQIRWPVSDYVHRPLSEISLVQIPVLIFTVWPFFFPYCVTMSKVLNLSVPPFPQM